MKRLNLLGLNGFSAGESREMYNNAFQIAWPSTLEGLLLSIISAVDTAMVKTVDKYAIASVNLTSQPRMILLILAQALCVGTTALVSRRKGENDRAGANSVLMQSMLLITGVGILISLCGYFLATPILKLAGASKADGTLDMAVDYFKVICAGLCLNCWNLCICAALRAVGNTRITMITNMTANIVNVCMNYCLIGGHFSFPALGVKGAAIATVIGTGTGCAIAFAFVLKKNGYLRLNPKLMRFDSRTMNGLVKVGTSSMAESLALRVGFFVNNRIIAGVGPDALTSNTIVSQITTMSFCLGDGIATAGATMVGQSLGARRKDKAEGYVKVSMRMAWVVSVFMMIVIFTARRGFARIFTDDEVIIAGASLAFVVCTFGMLPQNARVVYSGCLRGAGDVKYVAMCALLSVAIFRPICTYLLCVTLNPHIPWLQLSYTGSWIAFVLDAFVRTFLLLKRVKSGKFLDVKL